MFLNAEYINLNHDYRFNYVFRFYVIYILGMASYIKKVDKMKLGPPFEKKKTKKRYPEHLIIYIILLIFDTFL